MENKKQTNIEVGMNIKEVREAAGLTQKKLSERIGMSEKNLSEVERGIIGISIETLKNICKVLSVSSDLILFNKINEDSESKILVNRLSNLSPEHFNEVKIIANRLINMFSNNK